MTRYVVDASVAAKWFLPPDREPLAGEAYTLLEEYTAGRIRLLAPDLFWPEFGNVICKAVRQGRIGRGAAERAMEAISQTDMATAPCQPLLQDAFDIAVAFGRSVYDAVYVALAVSARATLVTADERLANALAAYFPVRWLGSM